MRLSSSVFAIALLSLGVCAQTGRPPTKVGTALDFPVFGPSSSAGSVFAALTPAVTAVQTFEFLPLLDATGTRVAGKFHATLTVTRQGGPSSEILMGTIDTTVSPWTFTDTTAANLGAINTTGFFHASMTADQLVFTTDTATACMFSVRSSRSQVFPALKPIGNLTGFVDSRVFTWNNSDWYAYSGGAFIQLWQFDRNQYASGNDPRVNGFWGLVGSVGFDPRSPGFLLNQTGQARAIIHAADVGGADMQARPYYNGLLQINNAEPSRRFHVGPSDASQFSYPGAIAGSTFYSVRDASQAYVDPKRIDIVASSGGVVGAGGGTFNLSAWLPYFDRNNPPPQPWALTILIGVPSMDLAIPGFQGKLALMPGFLALPARLWQAEDLSKDWSIVAPGLPAGTLLWAQTLAYDPALSVGGAGFYFGNTTRLLWQ